MRILGIDPGLRVTGFGLVDADHDRITYRGPDGMINARVIAIRPPTG